MSAKLNDVQRAYHPVERECLAVILELEKFRHYIEGGKLTVIIDYNSLMWLRNRNCQDPTSRIARWALRLQTYDFEVRYKRFSQNEPVCVLCREIDANITPFANFEELLSFVRFSRMLSAK